MNTNEEQKSYETCKFGPIRGQGIGQKSKFEFFMDSLCAILVICVLIVMSTNEVQKSY